MGGNTGVDLPAGKNLAGSFYSPKAVITDVSFLDTLPENIMADGFAEVIKYAIIADSELFAILKSKDYNISDIIFRCVSIKADIVSEDELDNGKRQILNFGHTIGHAIETLSGFEISHGCAVAIGMAKITKAAEKYGIVTEPCYSEITGILRQYGLPLESPYSDNLISGEIKMDKKRRGDYINFIVPKAIGKAEIYPVKADKAADFIGGGYDC